MTTTTTLATYKSYVRKRLDDPDFDDVTLTQFALDTNRELCNTKPWPFMETLFAGTMAPGFSSFLLPTDFQQSVNLIVIDPDGNALFIPYMEYEQVDKHYPDPSALTTGAPQIWTMWDKVVFVGPGKLDITYVVQMRYLRNPKLTLAGNSTLDVPDDFAELVVLGMFKRALMVNDAYDQAQIIHQEYSSQLDMMANRLLKRQAGESPRIKTGRVSWRS